MAILRGFPPSNTISPSIRIAENDLSFVQSDRSLHRAGLVGFASKGPVNIPTLIQTTRQLNTTFGFPHPQEGDPFLIYAAQQYLLVANELFVVRVADEEAVSDEAASSATVAAASAGGAISIDAEVAGGVGSEYIFDDDVFFKWKVNGLLKSNTLVAIAGTYSAEQLALELNDQLSTEFDGIQFFVNDSDEIAIRTTFAFGPSATLEFVSVANALYGGTVVNRNLVGTNNFPGFGTGMTVGATASVNDRYPDDGSSAAAGEWDFSTFTTPTLSVVVDGTDSITTDNSVQLIDFTDAITDLGDVLTTAEIATEINAQVLDGTLPGGFEAAGGGITGPSLVADAASAADNLTLRTLHHGADAQLLVKSDSGLQVMFAFDNLTASGSSPSGSSGATAEATYGIIFGEDASVGDISITLNADSAGVEGNNTQVVVTNDIGEGVFSLEIYNNLANVESWGNLTKDETSSFYIGTYVDLVSDYISIVDNTDIGSPPADGTYTLSGGSDGIPSDPDAQDALLIGDARDYSGMFALSEPEQIDIDLLAVPGHSSTSVILSMISVVRDYRQDALAIIDPPFGLTVQEIIDWQNGTHPLNNTRFDTDFAALYWPWVKLRDSFNKVDVWAPPSGSILAVIARSDSLAAPWFAPAGVNRGVVPSITDVFSRPTLAERDAMYGNSNAVNPIVQFTDIDGFLVWGQKTLQRRASALDRINVRRMMFFIEKEIRRRSKNLLFDPHDDVFVTSFKLLATEVLEQVSVGRGLTDFVIDASSELNTPDVIDRNEFRARIGVVPTRAVEFMFLEFSIHRTGSDFTESTEF